MNTEDSSPMDLRSILDRLTMPPEYPKPYFVVPDHLAEALQEAWGDGVVVIPISETRLPDSAKDEHV